MKFTLFPLIRNNRSGIILLVVLWILAILAILAIGLGRRTAIDLTLTKYTVGKIKAGSLAHAGLLFALNQLRVDTIDKTSSVFDTLYQCGIALDQGKSPEDIFKKVPLADGYFDISYSDIDPVTNAKKTYFGLQDEERRINLNGINQQTYGIFSNLLVLLGADPQVALTIANAVIDWQDADGAIANPPYGAEDDYYMSLPKPYHCKNMPFENIEELLLVEGMTPEIFSKVKNYVTVFPVEAQNFRVNIDTAPEIVVRSLARSVAGPMTNTGIDDADSMTNKVIAYRKGDDGIEFTGDDRLIDFNEIPLNEKEKVIFMAIRGYTTNLSRFFRIEVKGTDAATGISSQVEEIINRDDLSIVYWNKN